MLFMRASLTNSVTPTNGAGLAAVRVTFADLPAPYDQFNGRSMWVAAPRRITELSGAVDPINDPTIWNFWAATLQCTPHYTDWTAYDKVNIHHAFIVPGGRYELSIIQAGCAMGNAANFSPPLSISQSRWGNVAGPFDAAMNRWTAPEASGQIDITIDVVSVLEKFSNRPDAPKKVRVDVEPATVDFKINITDVSRALDAFRGLAYPFPPPVMLILK